MRKTAEELTLRVRHPGFQEPPPPPVDDTGVNQRWKPYVFTGLEKVSRLQTQLADRLEWMVPVAGAAVALQGVLERLRELFEQDVHMSVDDVRVLSPAECRRYLGDPTFFAVVAPAPHKARGFLEVDLGLAHAAIDFLLGGVGDSLVFRPLTDIEEGVMSFVVLEMLRVLTPPGEGENRLRMEAVAKSAVDVLAALQTESQVALIQFRTSIGSHHGFMRLVLPASLVELTPPLDPGPQLRARRAADLQRHIGRFSSVMTWLRAEIGHAEITQSQLAALHNGDVVLTDTLTARPDQGGAGTAMLRVGTGRSGGLVADVLVEENRYVARVKEYAPGEAPHEVAQPRAALEGEGEGAGQTEGEGSPEGVGAEADVGGEDAVPLGEVHPVATGEAMEIDEAEGEELDAGRIRTLDGTAGPAPQRRNVEQGNTVKEGAELLADVPLQLVVELARIPVTAEQIVGLKVGQVVDLNRPPGEPVEMSINGQVVARGQLVEVEGHLGVRILSLAR